MAFLACLAELTHPTLRSDFHFTTALMPSYDNATRAQALTLKLVGFSNAEIEKITGIQPQTVSAIHRKAIARGLNPEESKKILDHHVEDAPRSGRPRSRPKRLLQRSFQRSVEIGMHARKPVLKSLQRLEACQISRSGESSEAQASERQSQPESLTSPQK